MILKLSVALAAMLAASPALALTPTEAATRFVDSLAELEQAALHPFDSPDRTQARLSPGARAGLTFGLMDTQTRAAADQLLASVLSKKGLRLVDAVRRREKELGRLEKRPDHRDPDGYALAVFGTPGKEQWAVRLEGHHLSINLTLDGDRIESVMPLLIGANPREGEAGDPLLPFLQSAQAPDTLAPELAALFQPGSIIPEPDELDIDLVNLSDTGHPHLAVTSK